MDFKTKFMQIKELNIVNRNKTIIYHINYIV